MKYALLIVGDESAWADFSQEELDAWMKRILAWGDRLREKGMYTGEGAELVSPAQAKTVRGDVVIDGPYIEAKELIGGFDIITANSLEEAVEAARTWPGVAEGWVSVEVRQVIEH